MTTRRLVPLAVFGVALSLCLIVGCGSPQEEPPPPLCQEATQRPEEDDDDEEADDSANTIRPIRPEQWLRLIVEADVGHRASEDCAGRTIRMPEPSEACGSEIHDGRPVPLKLSEESVIDRRIDNKTRLIWIQTHEYPNGDALGPVALVERRQTEEENQINVLAAGFVRAPKLRVLLRTKYLFSRRPSPEEEWCTDPSQPGTCQRAAGRKRQVRRSGRQSRRDRERDAQRNRQRVRQVVIVESENCADPSEPDTCNRFAQFLLRRGKQLVQAELRHESGRCLGRASVAYTNKSVATLQEGGWQREFTLASSFDLDGGDVVVHEQVSAQDTDPNNADVPPRSFRTVDTDARWIPVAMHFVTENVPLWGRMLHRHGTTEVPPADDDEQRDACRAARVQRSTAGH